MFTVRVPSVRRLAAWLLIAQQVLVSAGVPLPCRAAAVRSSERFPCEHCGCGCRTAEQCWRQCCCFTNEEKIAWARANGVAVPEYVTTAAGRERGAAGKPKCLHCADRIAVKSEQPSALTSVANEQRRAKNGTDRGHGLCWLDVARCRGVTSYFEAAGPGWPADPPMQLHLALPLLGQIARQPFLGNPILPPAPPTPPPKNA